ncbi:cobalt-precorrin 5A hydrolase/precorrin-3B C17-methyltransferase [Hoeflea marina]|uniref:Cobalt-precorrin 5A hydrolase/precorrin-3B C17-methyltransferase n=1 Tax=Hoeflea marina TaxID=274592 RepID=A0A317PLN6_9HYPH|nr:precorrin-3B C(17)-methyltransferase [Hoeflea marina]PWV98973.1 cobalt-precorrin 5A hydrolase/precorrin-3B C17-methyltransferase [Hoeflea marina]
MSQQPAIVILSDKARPLADIIAAALGGSVHGLSRRVGVADVRFEDTGAHLAELFAAGRPIVALMAAGAVIRLIAPHLSDKTGEPPVISVAEDGSAVVPLLGGHHGANDMARKIAGLTGGMAAVTTAGDVRFGIALDAPPEGFSLANPQAAKQAMADLVGGAAARLEGEAPWLSQARLPLSDEGAVVLMTSDRDVAAPADGLLYHPKTLALGIGCERGCDADEAWDLAMETLKAAGLSPASVGVVVSLDVKADEAAVHAVAERLGCPARFFDAATLEAETPRLAHPSDVVFAEVGCHGVSEGAALAAVGASGALVQAKRKTRRATCAIACAAQPFTPTHLPGRGRGKLYVVGIGPGSDGWRSPEVSDLVRASTDLVGYSLYLDLLGPLARGKTRHDFDLGKEEARVRHAMELAGEGRDVALVCSGDAGIYAMATLVFELLDKAEGEEGLSDGARRIAIQCSPGISALQGAAARAGAPLGHDFCTISLSDLLTPWEDIQRRLKAAAEGDFVIAFYNPVSMKRRTQLAYARDRLLEHRPADTPVILATNLGRPGELVRVVPLGSLDVDDVDMLTVVIVGSSNTTTVRTGDGRQWVYTPRGYARKQGSAMTRQGSGQAIAGAAE